MPLAGKVKLKNFLLVVGILCLILCLAVGGLFAVPCMFGTWFTVSNVEEPDMAEFEPVEVATPVEEVTAAENVPAEKAPKTTPEPLHHAVVLGYQGKDLGTAKLKDVTQGRPFKVSVYQDEGKSTANRAKVDLDRDDKWDEKWTFEAGQVTRQDAPDDDENYTNTWVLVNDTWVAEGMEAPKEEEAPSTQPPYHAVVFGYQGQNIGTAKLKDVTQGKPFKVSVYQDAGSATVNRAKVDLDRDDKWDEKWTFGEDKTSRQVAPADDESYSETWVWTGLEWKLEV